MNKLTITPHAKQRLFERFGLKQIPEGKREFVRAISNNRRLWRAGEVFFIWGRETHKVVTALTADMVKKMFIGVKI